MPPREWLFRIQDILDAIAKIERATRGMQLSDFVQSEVVRDAVERNLIIVGEAARAVPEEVVAAHPQVPWAEMRGFRNMLVHEYFGVSTPRLWGTVRDDLPLLVPPLRRILEDGG